MKKLYILTILALATGVTAQAQRTVGGNDLSANYEINRNTNRDVTDTLSGPISAGCTNAAPALYTATDNADNYAGFVVGGNDFGDKEKAVFIATETSGLVYSALVFIGGKEGGTTEEFAAKLYGGTIDGGPTSVTATSAAVNYANLDTTGNYTTFAFDAPQAYDGSMFLSFEVDAVAKYGIITTNGQDCGSLSLWELWSDDSWNNLSGAWGGLDVAMYAFLEVELDGSVGLDDTNLIERGSEKFFPNPANESANLVFSLVEPSNITVRIYSTTGVLVDTYNPGFRNTGLSNITINTQSMSQGLYIYSIETEKGVRNGNFTVVR